MGRRAEGLESGSVPPSYWGTTLKCKRGEGPEPRYLDQDHSDSPKLWVWGR